jgi:hypothetical protein
MLIAISMSDLIRFGANVLPMNKPRPYAAV